MSCPALVLSLRCPSLSCFSHFSVSLIPISLTSFYRALLSHSAISVSWFSVSLASAPLLHSISLLYQRRSHLSSKNLLKLCLLCSKETRALGVSWESRLCCAILPVLLDIPPALFEVSRFYQNSKGGEGGSERNLRHRSRKAAHWANR